MSTTLTIYSVEEQKLPSALPALADSEKYRILVEAVERNGEVVEEFSTRVEALIQALEAIDKEIGETGFLPVFTFNNSPHNVLGDNPDTPCFGYFSPTATQDLDACLTMLPPEVVVQQLQRGYVRKMVYTAFSNAAKKASARGHALAIVHS